MINVVLDTNILVSSLWTLDGNPAKIIALMLENKLTPCYDYRIFNEYRNVLARPKLAFDSLQVAQLLEDICYRGLSVLVKSSEPSEVPLIDESDRKFYDVALACQAYLVTGNTKHFPSQPFIFTPVEFCQRILHF
jgi:putative PIN family toxin of toxin-antitoxin system